VSANSFVEVVVLILEICNWCLWNFVYFEGVIVVFRVEGNGRRLLLINNSDNMWGESGSVRIEFRLFEVCLWRNGDGVDCLFCSIVKTACSYLKLFSMRLLSFNLFDSFWNRRSSCLSHFLFNINMFLFWLLKMRWSDIFLSTIIKLQWFFLNNLSFRGRFLWFWCSMRQYLLLNTPCYLLFPHDSSLLFFLGRVVFSIIKRLNVSSSMFIRAICHWVWRSLNIRVISVLISCVL